MKVKVKVRDDIGGRDGKRAVHIRIPTRPNKLELFSKAEGRAESLRLESAGWAGLGWAGT